MRRVDFNCRFVVANGLIVFGWSRENARKIEIGFNVILVYVRCFLIVHLGLGELVGSFEMTSQVKVG